MRIVDIGVSLPAQKETLSDLVKFNPKWDEAAILSKTGIEERYIATTETAYSLALSAGREVMARNSDARPAGVILVTQSTEIQIPTTACRLHHDLGLSKDAFAFDVNQGCSGFIYGLLLAHSLLNTTVRESAIVICSDTYTKHISKTDRTCRPIFSDGATATLIERTETSGILGSIFTTDGSGAPNLCLVKSTGPGEDLQLRMEGAKVFVFTMSAVPAAVRALSKNASVNLEDIDKFVFHQASRLVLDNLQSSLNIPNDKMVRHLSSVGNTVSSSIPLALSAQFARGEIQPNMKVLCMGFGVGYSLAGCIIQT